MSTISVQGKLKFADNLWDGFDLLCKRTENDLNQSKNVLLFFKKRAELEDQHAKKLEKLVSKLIQPESEQPSTLNNGWKKIVNSTYTESEHHTLLNTSILNKVCMPFQAMIKDMEIKRKKIVNDGIRLRVDMKEMVEALKKSQQKYEKVSRDLELTRLELKEAKESPDTSPDTVSKIERRKERLELDQQSSDEEYKEQIKATNDFQHLFNFEQLPKILTDFEQFILQHGHLTKTYWTNWSNIINSQPQLFSQSYDGVKKVVEHIDNPFDIQEFIKKNQSKKVVTQPFLYEPYVEGKLDRKKSAFTGLNTLRDQLFRKKDEPNTVTSPTMNRSGGSLPVKEVILPTASYGVNLEELMAKQKDTHPNLEVPRVMVVLAESICKLKGHVYEGIFRVPGIVSNIKQIKLRIDQGNFDLSSIDDVRTSAALFKLWLRDIPDPIIPSALYKSAVDNPTGACELVKKIPAINLKVLTYLIHFIQIFCKYEFVAHSKMGTSNMAMIFAPTILRCPSNDPNVLLNNVNNEKAFVENLIANTPHNPDEYMGLPVQASDALMENENDIEELDEVEDDNDGSDNESITSTTKSTNNSNNNSSIGDLSSIVDSSNTTPTTSISPPLSPTYNTTTTTPTTNRLSMNLSQDSISSSNSNNNSPSIPPQPSEPTRKGLGVGWVRVKPAATPAPPPIQPINNNQS